MNRFTMSNLALLMSYKVSPREIEKLADRLNIAPADNLDVVSPQGVGIATLQLMIKRYTSLTDYIVDMNLYIADAVNRRAQLICFPAYAGMLPITFLPQFEDALAKIRPQEDTGLPDIEKLHDSLAYFSDFTFDAFYHTMSTLASRHRVYIMAGSVLYFDDSELCHRAFLFNKDGEMVGYQDKISLSPLEQELQIEPASEIKVFETPMGPVSILIGSDADYYETARIAKNLGAQILLQPTAYNREFTPVDTALGLNMRVQETLLYGVQSVLTGDTGLGFAVEGAANIFAPGELLRSGNGVLAQTSGRFEPDIACAKLDLDKLLAIQNPYIQDVNPELLKKYIDRLY